MSISWERCTGSRSLCNVVTFSNRKKNVKYLWKIFWITHLWTTCVHFPNVQAKMSKRVKVLSLEHILKAIEPSKSFIPKLVKMLLAKCSNVVYRIECTLSVIVVKTKGSLNKHMSGHRFEINKGGQQLLYKHFNSANHSI
jgi:hypothetical protein